LLVRAVPCDRVAMRPSLLALVCCVACADDVPPDSVLTPEPANIVVHEASEVPLAAVPRVEEPARAIEPAVEAPPEPPQPTQEEIDYPLQGIATHFLAQVFAGPNRDRPIAYMRRGARFRAKPGVRGPGCTTRWHEVPGGGFVCRGDGSSIASTPPSFEPVPRSAALEDALPYPYAYVTVADRPQYWVLPTLEQEDEAAAAIARLVAEEARAAEQAAERAATPDAGAPDAGVPAPAEAVEGESPATDVAQSTIDVDAPPPPGLEAEAEAEVEEVHPDEEDDALPDFLRMRMHKGFYVSLDRREATTEGRLFYRTVRGGYVRVADMTPNEPPTSRGVVLGGSWSLPLAIVHRRGAHSYERDPSSARIRDEGPIDRHSVHRVSVESERVGGQRYIVTARGLLIRESHARVVRSRARPEGVGPSANWIHVDLSQQSLVAYEGDTPVFATLVSSGREGFETPTGLYRIQSKHVSTTMDDLASETAYSIEDVPWTMYFYGNYALHGAFWHYTFGTVRSHGCINLAPADARWLFYWTSPDLPAAWHGVFAGSTTGRGTYVFIEE
jgi:hypothetical protein